MTAVEDVMTPDPVVLGRDQTIEEAAAAMRARAAGTVLVAEGSTLLGLVTDRDIVVRALADGMGPQTPLSEVCTPGLVAVDAAEDTGMAAQLMRENAVRRLAVLDDGRLAGIVSLGDLAVEADGNSVLGQISAATPTA